MDAERETEIHRLTTRLENERHHWGHDLSEMKAKYRLLLNRIDSLLSDAADALEVTPSIPSLALKRVEAARKALAAKYPDMEPLK